MHRETYRSIPLPDTVTAYMEGVRSELSSGLLSDANHQALWSGNLVAKLQAVEWPISAVIANPIIRFEIQNVQATTWPEDRELRTDWLKSSYDRLILALGIVVKEKDQSVVEARVLRVLATILPEYFGSIVSPPLLQKLASQLDFGN